MFSASQSYTGISEKNDGIDKAYPEVKQRGFYSDFICNANDAFVDSQVCFVVRAHFILFLRI